MRPLKVKGRINAPHFYILSAGVDVNFVIQSYLNYKMFSAKCAS